MSTATPPEKILSSMDHSSQSLMSSTASADCYLDSTLLALTFLGITPANTRLLQPKRLLLVAISTLWECVPTLIKLRHIVSSIFKLEKTRLSQDSLSNNWESSCY